MSYVAGRPLEDGGVIYQRGDLVPQAAGWDPHVIASHKSVGSLLDLTPEQYMALREEEAAKAKASRHRTTVKRQSRYDERRKKFVVEVDAAQKVLNTKVDALNLFDKQFAEDQKGLNPNAGESSGGGASVKVPPPPSVAPVDVVEPEPEVQPEALQEPMVEPKPEPTPKPKRAYKKKASKKKVSKSR